MAQLKSKSRDATIHESLMLMAQAAYHVQELKKIFTPENIGKATGVTKQGVQYHIDKIKKEKSK
jgi:hypothetical protein